MNNASSHIQAIVFDWAGTMIDHGSRAPASVFREIFRRRGVEITEAMAREPMGMAKRDHIATISRMPPVASKWKELFGSDCTEADIDAMYADFLPLQKETLAQHLDLIPGVADAFQQCRQMGLKIGSSTGYTRELMELVVPAAKEQGYDPDCVLCSEDAPRGRPAPYLLFEAAKRLDVYPMWRVVKVDDTPVGIQAGRNAGCWTVGITRTGNGVGRSIAELEALSKGEVDILCQKAAADLSAAGAHFLLESAADIAPMIESINKMLSEGDRP
ncbi:MAG: phosphonoacetaldehyde hydrolase [Planctomycetaceae bacterium]|nr:phosphonoacetaldehyde hydrolase [Planctomycetaceae bacterium]